MKAATLAGVFLIFLGLLIVTEIIPLVITLPIYPPPTVYPRPPIVDPSPIEPPPPSPPSTTPPTYPSQPAPTFPSTTPMKPDLTGQLIGFAFIAAGIIIILKARR